MLETTNKLSEGLQTLSKQLAILSREPGFTNAQSVVNSVIGLLGIKPDSKWTVFSDSQGKIRSNAGWFMLAEGFADRRATYKIADNNDSHIDFKAYWVKNVTKSITSWLVALTPNFEDEPFYKDLNLGADFIIPEKCDRIYIALSKNYIVRKIELYEKLSITQQEIFYKWTQDLDFSNKAQVHETLWQSFDLEPLNKSFYTGTKERPGIVQFFNELVQYLIEDTKVFEKQDATLFVNRLIGRIIFCWFLDKKGLLDKKQVYFETNGKKAKEYYETKLEKLFFRTLNTQIQYRKKDPFALIGGLDTQTPFLNGGLFFPKTTDHFGEKKLKFPADYFDRFFEFLNHYNFTTDESTSTFQQVAIDPEMLGRILENLLAEQIEETGEQARKAQGAFYTPREIVDYICKETLREYLKTRIPEDDVRDQRISQLIDSKPHEFRDQQRNYRRDLAPYKHQILQALEEAKILDPACGSGAFPMGMLHLLLETYERLDATFDPYKKKIEIIKNNLFGIDIEPMAVEIARLRAWLAIVVDEIINPKKDNLGIEPLPNLDFKFVCANTLVTTPQSTKEGSLFEDPFFSKLEILVEEYFSLSSGKGPKRKEIEALIGNKIRSQLDYVTKTLSRSHLGQKFDELKKQSNKEKIVKQTKEIGMWQSYRNIFTADEKIDFFETKYFFPSAKKGFDIVISNPPYVSTKGKSNTPKEELTRCFGFADDLYNHFYYRGINLLKENGVLSYISSNTFWTIQTKRNLRELLQRKRLIEIYDSANPFKTPLVDTCITIVRNKEYSNYKVRFKDGRENLLSPICYEVNIDIYKNAVNQAIFKPTDKNLKIYKKYNDTVKVLLNKWWNGISTSKNIAKNRRILDEYRKKVKPGDITLLGLITDGGQGLATANNGKYIGVLEGTRYADSVLSSRPIKLADVVSEYKIKELSKIKDKNDAIAFLSKKSEDEIRSLFDLLKEKYGRDIFGQGYLYRIVKKSEIVDVEKLTNSEKENGISGKKTFVPYDKGEKEGHKWYARTPYYIDWSKENVEFLQSDPNARWQGYNFYFKEGFCWTLTLNQFSEYQKARIRNNGIFDVNAMSLFPILHNVNSKYLVCLFNSYLIYLIKYNFLNNTSAFQINDARQLPIIVPSKDQLKDFEAIFDEAYKIKQKQFENRINGEVADKKLSEIQKELDVSVLKLYKLQ